MYSKLSNGARNDAMLGSLADRLERLIVSFVLTILLVILALFQPESVEAATITLPQDQFRFNIAEKLNMFEDSESSKQIHDIIELCNEGRCLPTGSSNLQFGYSSKVYWFHFNVSSSLTQQRSTYLEVRYPPLDYINVYVVNGEGDIKELKGGDRIPLSKRLTDARYHLFPIKIGPESDYNIFIRIQSESSISIPIFYSSELALFSAI